MFVYLAEEVAAPYEWGDTLIRIFAHHDSAMRWLGNEGVVHTTHRTPKLDGTVEEWSVSRGMYVDFRVRMVRVEE